MIKRVSCLAKCAAVGISFFAIGLASSAAWSAPRVCGERAKMTKFLAGKYQENPRAIGVVATGKSVIEIYTSQKGSWTVLMTSAAGLTCIMGAGHSWQDKDQTAYLPKS